MTTRHERRLRIGRRVVLVVAVLISVLCVGLLLAAIRNDSAITGHLGVANAEVDSVSFDRTIIRYETPDGIVHIPANGVLYPRGLAAGDLVRIEYDTTNPELARVAGRTATLTLLPLGTTMLGTWLVAGGLLWWIRQRTRTGVAATSASSGA
ncbi:DUF3592 domain-containing protein [Amycolatopsis taiwanensis]|uniref:DUF3592 domain-containing protein n=1 Tax=Amycolatopsis taiwanensis TaxID=342230 RepID=A0A9W6QVI3_9PSEU|nr:DUF3592 domain-containing protein [Amycolatopsis taiwanensis]GLY63705.1 hypothetical protein Atai01_03240 [Amycolatopsis taiwanensis]